MEKTKINFGVLVTILLSYFFFATYIINQIGFNSFGKNYIFFSLGFKLLIFIGVLIFILWNNKIASLKIIEIVRRRKKSTSYFLFKVVLSIYLLFSLILAFFYPISLLTTYYYPQISFAIIQIIILVPIIFIFLKGNKVLNRFAMFSLFVFVIINLLYVFNSHFSIFSPIHFPTMALENIILLISLGAILLFEPLLFVMYCNENYDHPKIPIFKTLILLFILIGFSIYFDLRLNVEFSSLLGILKFPYLESWKYLNFSVILKQIDFINIFYYLFLIITRTCFVLFTFKSLWNIKLPFIPIVLLIIASISTVILLANQSIFQEVFSTIITLLATTISMSGLLFFHVTRGKNL